MLYPSSHPKKLTVDQLEVFNLCEEIASRISESGVSVRPHSDESIDKLAQMDEVALTGPLKGLHFYNQIIQDVAPSLTGTFSATQEISLLKKYLRAHRFFSQRRPMEKANSKRDSNRDL